MDSQRLLILVSFYGTLLFAIAWMAEKYGHKIQKDWWRPLIYTLSIGVYCSSWTFLGAVGQAVENGWHFLPIYLGPILLIVFGWGFIRRLLIVSSRNKITSIADFVGSRYGKHQPLAAIVTLVLVVGTLPYIALQLRAVGIAWSTVNWQSISDLSVDYGSSLVAAMVMGWFAIAFGTRIIDGPDRLRGMISAVALESVVKLVAFICVAMLAWEIYPITSFGILTHSPNFQWSQIFSPLFLTEMLLAATAIICLPRQFHVMVVEYQHKKDLRYTRWLLPLYLALFALLAIPLAQTGAELFTGLHIPPDSYVLTLPHFSGEEGVLAITFIGALSAAAGMVVVATIALSIMISNELIVPAWLRVNSRHHKKAQDLGNSLRFIRRFSIISILAMSWALERIMSQNEGLASLGLISFAACAQLLPAVLAALYWERAHAKGVMAGLLSGMCIWFYCLLLPIIVPPENYFVTQGLFSIEWLKPHNFLFMGFLDPLSHGVFWSLCINVLVFVLVSKASRFTSLDLRQAEAFTHIRGVNRRYHLDREPSGIEIRQLQSLIEPLFGKERCESIWQEFEQLLGHRLLPHDQAPRFTVAAIESDMAAIIGAVSARKAMELLASQQPLLLQDFVSLVSGSSRQIQFSQTLLQTTLETIPQGISVVDKDLKLVAWNQQYQTLFDYPQRLLYVGCDIEKVYYYNAVRGYLGDEDNSVDEIVSRRITQLRSGQSYRLERVLPNKKVIEISGTPLDNGGYVTTFTDISDHYKMVHELEDAKQSLEDRVNIRTMELQAANHSLLRENELRGRIEEELTNANTSKNRFMAAASHDLLQPINASRLFVSSLGNQVNHSDNEGLKVVVKQLDDALSQTEHLIGSLREISRLGSGKEQANRKHFSLESLFTPLTSESQVLAEKSGLDFHCITSSIWVYSDPHLLRRVLQNFVSNALRYTKTGRVVLGCRRKNNVAVIEVWDTGPGIAEENRDKIFEEFERLPGSSSQGLGLGLSITNRISHLLSHPISMNSILGKGSVFRITVPLGKKSEALPKRAIIDPNLKDTQVLCVDNDPLILSGMQSLLEQWGCNVSTAADLKQALNNWRQPQAPDIVLADFHLDHETGIDVLEALRFHWQQTIPAIVISADNSDEIRQQASTAECMFLSKPVPPNALRNLMHRALRNKR